MAKSKRYGRRMRAQSFLDGLGSRLDTKGNVKNASLETGKDFILSVMVGGAVAAIIGKPSLLVGAGVTGLGYYLGAPVASNIGVGMMATTVGSMLNQTGVSGTDGLDGVKERLAAFRQSILERTYLDKILRKPSVSGVPVGELQYFDYGKMAGMEDGSELLGTLNDTDELAALDAIDQQIEQAGFERLKEMDLSGLSALNLPEDQVTELTQASPSKPPTPTGLASPSDTQIFGNNDPSDFSGNLAGKEDREIGIPSIETDSLLGDLSDFNY